jgi:hypothetical protein
MSDMEALTEELTVLDQELQAAANIGRSRTDPRVEDSESRTDGRFLLGGFSLNMELSGEKDDSYHYRWFVDRSDRIRKALMAGYRPVLLGDGETDLTNVNSDQNLADQGQWIQMKSGSHDSGKPEISYLMAIKKEFYQEDQAKKQHVVDSTEAAIHGGTLGSTHRDDIETHNAQGKEVTYVKQSSLKNEFKR